MNLEEAIHEIEQGRCERIAAPGKWKVWRVRTEAGDTKVQHEVIGK